MKKLCLIFALYLLAQGTAFSQEEKKSSIHVSFVPPLSTNGKNAPQYTNDVSFNILVGVSRNENKFTLGSLANIILNDANGIQIAGLFNGIGNTGNGMLLSGLLNMAKNEYNGIQIAGLLNQTKTMNGMQIAGLGNIAGDVNGMQIGGLFNIARRVNGIQIGTLFNIAENGDYPIGLVNIIRDGEKSLGVSYNETGSIIAAFRSGGRVLYGIVGVGYNHKADDEKLVFEGGFGGHINMASKLRLNLELKGAGMTSFSGTYVNHSSFSALAAYRILPKVEIFAGPGINFIETDNVKNKDMLPGHSIWKKHREDKLQQLYIGYSAGLHFLF